MNSRGHRACRVCEIERTATPEVRQRITEWQRGQQDRTRGNAVNNGRPWDPEDNILVMKLRAAGTTQGDIAMIMGRTYSAIRKQVGILVKDSQS